MTDIPAVEDAARQGAQRDDVKKEVQDDVNADITRHAEHSSGDRERVGEVASELRASAIDETVHGERVVARARTAARFSQFVDYAFYVVYSLLAIRLVLALIAADSGNGFVRLIGVATGPFYGPFEGIVASPSSADGNTLLAPILVALLVYAILHAGINGLLRMVGHRKTTV